MSAVQAFDDVIDFPEGARVVSYLPMAHIAERATGHYMPIVLGHTVTCCPNPREVIAYLPEVRPSWFFAVPRIWEKLKAGLEAMIESEQDEERKRALKWALDVGHQKVRLEQAGEPVPAELAAGAREGRRDGAVEAARAARPRPARGGLRRRGADAARGARVLPRDRGAGRGAVGPVGEHAAAAP